MQLPAPIRNNLYFLLAETTAQMGDLQVLLESAAQPVARRSLDRRGYAYNLKMRIHDGCLNEVRRAKSKKTLDFYSLRAAEAIASELERLIDLSHECIRQIGGPRRGGLFKTLSSSKLLDDVMDGLDLTGQGLDEDDARTALKIGKSARKVRRKYDTFFQRYARTLKKAKRPEEGVSVLLVAHRVKEMGSALVNVSEAIMSANMGHPMHLDRFRFLETALEDLGMDGGAGGAEVETIAETKSGSGISGIAGADQDGYRAIFKDGAKDKLKEERESVESWHEIFPGLAPQILSYRKRGASASLLIEHLPGFTFEQVLLNESDELLRKTVRHLTKTVNAVWKETKRSKKVQANHMGQLRKRLDDVLKVHAEFGRGAGRVCGARTPSLDELITAAEKIEAKLAAPFSVYIHGDFNLDNIIFDPDEKRINFIDLHRSCYSDYVQDVSVFMVSNYRLQVLDRKTRKRINLVASEFYDFAADYAKKHKDKTFELRLAFGLGRSFITSTRFILDKVLAKNMYLRGVYILERALEHTEKTAPEFKLPVRELF